MTDTRKDLTPEQRRDLPMPERDAIMMHLRTLGWTYRAISEYMGYGSHTTIARHMQAIYVKTVREPTEIARALEVERYDNLLRKAMEVLNHTHYAHSQGRVITRRLRDDDGEFIIKGYSDDGDPIYETEDLIDDAPTLQAIQTILKISERRAKLLGLDAPAKVETWTVTTIDAKIAELERELAKTLENGNIIQGEIEQ